MRITPQEARALADLARAHFGPGCEVRLFGSRVDDAARGGDVDTHVAGVDPDRATLRAELGFQSEARDAMGDVEVDVVVLPHGAEPGPLDRIALRRGVLLA